MVNDINQTALLAKMQAAMNAGGYGGNPYGGYSPNMHVSYQHDPYAQQRLNQQGMLGMADLNNQAASTQAGLIAAYNNALMNQQSSIYGHNTNYAIAQGNDAGATERAKLSAENQIALQNLMNQGSQGVANINAGAARYGADASRDASQYGSDRAYQGQVYNADANKYLGDVSANSSRYGWDTQANLGRLNADNQLALQRLQNEGARYAPDLQQKRFDSVMGILGGPASNLLSGLVSRMNRRG